jgi:hypothetical protein
VRLSESAPPTPVDNGEIHQWFAIGAGHFKRRAVISNISNLLEQRLFLPLASTSTGTSSDIGKLRIFKGEHVVVRARVLSRQTEWLKTE